MYQLSSIEQTAGNCQVDTTVVHFRRAKGALCKALRHNTQNLTFATFHQIVFT